MRVILPVRLRVKKEKRELRLIDPDTKVWNEKAPLYLLDGYITRNEKKILDLDISEIERIDLFINFNTLTKQFGVLGGNGVMAFYTKERKSKLDQIDLANTFKIQGVHQPKAFMAGAAMKKDKRPDFRSVVYWNPNIQTDENGRAVLEFYHSDDISDFLIEVNGYTSGQKGKGFASYKVGN